MPPYGMYTLTTVLFIWIAILLPDVVRAQDDAGDISVDKVVPVGGGVKADDSESSYQVASDGPPPASPSQAPLSADIPDFSLTKEQSGEICLRAVFRATFVVQYMTKGLPKTKMLPATIEVPSTKAGRASVSGKCGEKNSTLDISWLHENNSFSLRLVFEKMDKKSSFSLGIIPSWAVTSLSLTFDTRNNTAFPNIVSADSDVTVTSAPEEMHFSTPANFSYSCGSQEDITLQVYNNKTADTSVINAITMSVWDARIQGFYMAPTADFSLAVQCPADMEKALPGRNIVPMVVAACLAGVIVIIVIVYFFVKNKTQSIYSSME